MGEEGVRLRKSCEAAARKQRSDNISSIEPYLRANAGTTGVIVIPLCKGRKANTGFVDVSESEGGPCSWTIHFSTYIHGLDSAVQFQRRKVTRRPVQRVGMMLKSTQIHRYSNNMQATLMAYHISSTRLLPTYLQPPSLPVSLNHALDETSDSSSSPCTSFLLRNRIPNVNTLPILATTDLPSFTSRPSTSLPSCAR